LQHSDTARRSDTHTTCLPCRHTSYLETIAPVFYHDYYHHLHYHHHQYSYYYYYYYKYRNCPSARRASAANAISGDIGMLNGRLLCMKICWINYANCGHYSFVVIIIIIIIIIMNQ
jgi:hypothetical protein